MKQGQRDWPKLMLRLPPDAKAWVEDQATKYGTSLNSEVVRSVRERMERQTKTAPESAGTLAEA